MNAAIGTAGVTLGLAGSLFGILTLAVGLRQGDGAVADRVRVTAHHNRVRRPAG